MSREKYRAEAGRWLAQARADLRAAKASAESDCCEWASFQAQQAGEKALKALWYSCTYDPWGHSLLALIRDFPDPEARAALTVFEDDAKQLDKLYIPTRYPNGLPDLTPAEVFTAREAKSAMQAALRIADWVADRIGVSS
jgi:HEPN domain-containing protein